MSRAHIEPPYVDAQTGELCISTVRAVLNGGKLTGVVSADVFVTDLQDITLNATLDASGYSMLIGQNGDIFVQKAPAATFNALIFPLFFVSWGLFSVLSIFLLLN